MTSSWLKQKILSSNFIACLLCICWLCPDLEPAYSPSLRPHVLMIFLPASGRFLSQLTLVIPRNQSLAQFWEWLVWPAVLKLESPHPKTETYSHKQLLLDHKELHRRHTAETLVICQEEEHPSSVIRERKQKHCTDETFLDQFPICKTLSSNVIMLNNS